MAHSYLWSDWQRRLSSLSERGRLKTCASPQASQVLTTTCLIRWVISRVSRRVLPPNCSRDDISVVAGDHTCWMHTRMRQTQCMTYCMLWGLASSMGGRSAACVAMGEGSHYVSCPWRRGGLFVPCNHYHINSAFMCAGMDAVELFIPL